MRNLTSQRRDDVDVPALAPNRALLPNMPLPVRYFLGLGLMTFCLWLPTFISLFRR